MKSDLKYDDYKQYEVLYKNKQEFDDSWKKWGDSYSHRFKFDNEYGASVVKHFGSYGYEDDLFELGVVWYGDNEFGNLTYNTDITNDVIGYLTNEQVLELLERIKNLDESGRENKEAKDEK